MKKLIVILLLIGVCVYGHAQKISVKSVSLRQTDLKASREPRNDVNGKACAIVRVGVVGVNDLVFPDAVGDVKYALGEYIVYVPEGLQSMKYHDKSGANTGSVVFDDYGLDVETKRVYSVVFESENHMRAAIFSIQPVNAKLTFNGQSIPLDDEGFAIIEKPIGTYEYKIDASGYILQSGTVKLTEEDITTTTSVILEQRQYPLTITCQPKNATLFIDNSPYGQLDSISDLKLPDGQHIIRLTAIGYNDYEQTLTVDGQAANLLVNMVQMKERIVEHKGERTRTHINIRPAFYISGGADLYDKKQYLGHEWGLRLSLGAMQHFAGIFSVYEGIAVGGMTLNKKEMTKWYEHPADSANSYFVEIPVLAGISIPFGKYNKHLCSILGGVYGKGIFTEIVDESSNKSAGPHGNGLKTRWDYGLRGMLIVDISRFSVSATVGISLAKFDKYRLNADGSQSTTKDSNKPNFHFGITLGAKLGKL
jgi:hypothetical protein